MGGLGTKTVWTLVVAVIALLSTTASLIGNLGGARNTICSLPAAKATCLQWGLVAEAPPEEANSVSLPGAQDAATMQAPDVTATPGAERASNPNDISGSWTGYYAGGGNPRTKFDLDIAWRAPGTFRGVILEEDTIGRGRGVVYSTDGQRGAAVTGTTSADGTVRFTKQYDCTDGVCHDVIYEGVLDEAGRTITGTWSIGTLRGQFRISRP